MTSIGSLHIVTCDLKNGGPVESRYRIKSDAAEAFKAELAKTPAEKEQERILRRHGVSAKDMQSLPAAVRRSIEAEIAQAARRAVEAAQTAVQSKGSSSNSTWGKFA